MQTFETLFAEVASLKEAIKLYNRGLLPYEYIKATLTNISVEVDYILEFKQPDNQTGEEESNTDSSNSNNNKEVK